MSSDPWTKLEAIFGDALRLEPAQRSAFLDGACENDDELRRRVDSLLVHSDSSGTFIRAAIEVAEAGIGAGEPAISDLSPGTVVGAYRLERELGRGGMGEVWLANQTEPVKRQVALKLIKRGMDSRQVVTRFEVERQALALMDHPATARVFDAGTTADGRPFFAMEYIEGLPITHHCDQHRLTTRERLELFVQVCEGVNHAHQKGIIHRDLKPSNVLVAVHDQSTWPKIIDFGIAKAIDQRLSDGTLLTGHHWIGTPEYMSPEQAELTRQDIDTRSDVYSLGVLLYELLVGALPLDSEPLRDLGFDEIRRRIREDDPPTPSTRLSRLGDLAISAANRKTAPGALKRELRGDLDWITMKALEKDRDRRYGSASELAEDVRRYLANLPVGAGPPGALYRTRKFARRHQAAVTAVAVAVVGLPLLMGLFAWQQRERAREEGRLRQVVRRQLYISDMRLASQAFHEGRIDRLEELLDKHRVQPGDEDLRRFEWYHWWRAARLNLVLPSLSRRSWERIAASPDGRLVAVVAATEAVIYGAESHREVATLAASGGAFPFGTDPIVFSPDGELFASDDGTAIAVWSTRSWIEGGVEKRSPARRLVHRLTSDALKARVLEIAFSPTAPILASGDELGRIEVWNHQTGAVVQTLDIHHQVAGLAFSADGRSLFVATHSRSSPNSLFVCDPRSGGIVLAASVGERGAWAFAYSPRTRRLATVSREQRIRLWNERLEPLASIPTTGIARSLAFSPDGQRLAAGTMGTNNVLVWELGSEPKPIATLKGHSNEVSGVAFVGSGGTIWSASIDATVRIWDLSHAQPYETFHDPVAEGTDLLSWPSVALYSRQALAYSGDGRRLTFADQGGAFRSWSVVAGRWQADRKDSFEYRSVAASNGSSIAVGLTSAGQLRVWDIGGVEPPSEQILTEETAKLVGVERGGTIVGLTRQGVDGIVIRDLVTGRSKLIATEGGSARAQLSVDGRLLQLVLPYSGEMWDVSTDPPRRLWRAPPPGQAGQGRGTFRDRDMTSAFSPDGRTVAIGRIDIRLHDAETGTLQRRLRGNMAWVRSLDFSPDGRSLVSGAYDGAVRIWDTESGDERSLLGHHIGSVEAVAFSPIGDSVASASSDGELRIWLTATKKETDRVAADGENDRLAHR